MSLNPELITAGVTVGGVVVTSIIALITYAYKVGNQQGLLGYRVEVLEKRVDEHAQLLQK